MTKELKFNWCSSHKTLHYAELLQFSLKEDLVKTAGDSLLIHASAYPLFVGVYSVRSDMTGYSHSCHWIKLIYCGCTSKRCIEYCHKLCLQRQMVTTHIFYFMLCQSSLLNTVISFVCKVSHLLYGKYLKKNSFIPSPH